jgi:predicted ATPase
VPAPAPASSFVGRTAELRALTALLARERLVTVVGPGGCGKTRLAIEAVAGQPLHGFVELAAAGPATDLARAASTACGQPEEPGRAPLDLLVELGDGLLVLDK